VLPLNLHLSPQAVEKIGETARLESHESLILFSDWLAQFEKIRQWAEQAVVKGFVKMEGALQAASRYLNM
jgi:hypothetical protein